MTARDRTGATALVAAAATGLVAFAFVLAGGLLLWANGHYRDGDGYLSTPSGRFESPEYALATRGLDVDAGAAGLLVSARRYGELRLRVTAKGGKPLFAGIARTRDVDAFLRGTSYSALTDISTQPFRPASEELHGTRKPGPPARSPIWVARGDGDHPLHWDVRPGEWSVVVMNADGSRGFTAAISAGAKIPAIARIAYGALGLGLLFVIATATLTAYGCRPVARTLAAASV